MESIPFGNRVRLFRVAAGLTQQTLAERAGIALRTLSLIENGEDTRLSTLYAIAEALDIPLRELLGDGRPNLAAS